MRSERGERLRHRTGWAIALAAAAVLAACQPAPRPFAAGPDDRAGNPLLLLPDRGGIVVRTIAGAPAPVSRRLAEAMVAELLRQNVPAATAGGNRSSYFLDGSAALRRLGGGRTEFTISWNLVDNAGKRVGGNQAREAAPGTGWGALAPDLISRVVRSSAPGIAGLVQHRSAAPIDPARTRPLYVSPVVGAPGDGGNILRLAMMGALRRARLSVVREPGAGSLVIAGRMTLAAPVGGRRDMEIVWSVLRPDGKKVGDLTQRNAVGEHDFDGDWRNLAHLIAEGAAGGVVDLLHRLAPEKPSGIGAKSP